jgi:electron transport complex protein RnfA
MQYAPTIQNRKSKIVNKFMEYIGLILVAIFVNNIVYSQFLGICPFLGVSKKVDTAIGMGAAVAFVLAISTLVTFLLQKGILEPFGLQYLQTIVFILIIASLVQLIEIILKKAAPALYQALGVFLPLMSTNCLILGTCILVIQKNFSLLPGMVYAISISVGFMLALIIFSGVREQLALTKIPKAMQGMPIAIITAGIIAMAFMGFSGIDQVFK